MSQLQMNEAATDRGMNLARQAIYRFASLTLLDPRAGAWAQLNDAGVRNSVLAAAELLRTDAIASRAEPARGEHSPDVLDPAPVFALLPGSSDALNAEYEATFGLLVSGDCPPYETEYIDSKFAFQRSQQLAEIAGYYQAFGLEPSHRYRERQDHIALELEFMAVVIGLELRAAAQSPENADAARHVADCRQAQARFLGDHLAWWTPTFARLLTLLHAGGFYAASARFLMALLPIERALLEVAPVLSVVQPHSLERPDECEGCLVQPL